MLIDNKYLKVAEDGALTFLYPLWKLPTADCAFPGTLEGKPSKEQEFEIANGIYARRNDWLQYGPRSEAWEQLAEVTHIIGKKLIIQMRSPIMFLHEGEAPHPFEAFCSGLNLTLNNDGFLQCYMCLKDVSCPQTAEVFDGCGRLNQSPDGVSLLNMGDVYKISIYKIPEHVQFQKQSTEEVSIINGKPGE